MEYRTQNAEAPLGRELIAMGKIELLAMEFDKAGLTVDNHTALFLEIVETPHVVVACEEVYLYSPVGKLGYLAEETGIALGNGIAVLIPEVEHIPEHIHGSSLILDFVEERYQTALMCTAVLNGPGAKMCIGKEIDFLHSNCLCCLMFNVLLFNVFDEFKHRTSLIKHCVLLLSVYYCSGKYCGKHIIEGPIRALPPRS